MELLQGRIVWRQGYRTKTDGSKVREKSWRRKRANLTRYAINVGLDLF